MTTPKPPNSASSLPPKVKIGLCVLFGALCGLCVGKAVLGAALGLSAGLRHVSQGEEAEAFGNRISMCVFALFLAFLGGWRPLWGGFCGASEHGLELGSNCLGIKFNYHYYGIKLVDFLFDSPVLSLIILVFSLKLIREALSDQEGSDG